MNNFQLFIALLFVLYLLGIVILYPLLTVFLQPENPTYV